MSEVIGNPMGHHDEETESRLVEEMVRKICIFESEELLVDFLDELKNHRISPRSDSTMVGVGRSPLLR
ncbi:hypothetical protein EYC08_19255 [Tabrizicola sp. WMC-M-20]|nr:hypothetical protein EYC08_19255 [Tabrizicola sp. WMC-M-20]